MQRMSLALAFAAVLTAGVPAFAGPQVNTEPTSTNASNTSETDRSAAGRSAEVGDPDRQICKKITYTGSRLGGERVCKSAREWGAIQRDARENTERQQRPSWKSE